MRMYSYIVESLPDGRWRWTVFGERRKAVRSGSAKDEHAAKLAAVNAIDELKMRDRKPSLRDDAFVPDNVPSPRRALTTHGLKSSGEALHNHLYCLRVPRSTSRSFHLALGQLERYPGSIFGGRIESAETSVTRPRLAGSMLATSKSTTHAGCCGRTRQRQRMRRQASHGAGWASARCHSVRTDWAWIIRVERL